MYGSLVIVRLVIWGCIALKQETIRGTRLFIYSVLWTIFSDKLFFWALIYSVVIRCQWFKNADHASDSLNGCSLSFPFFQPAVGRCNGWKADKLYSETMESHRGASKPCNLKEGLGQWHEFQQQQCFSAAGSVVSFQHRQKNPAKIRIAHADRELSAAHFQCLGETRSLIWNPKEVDCMAICPIALAF